MTVQELSQFLSKCPKLQELHLQNVTLTSKEQMNVVEVFNGRQLNIEQSKISSLALSQLLLLFPRLKFLHLDEVIVQDEDTPFLFEGRALADLERFSVQNIRISQQAIEQLIQNLKRVTSFILDYNIESHNRIQSPYHISPPIIDAISSPHLSEVWLNFERITRNQLIELLRRNRQLYRLEGSGTKLCSTSTDAHDKTRLSDLIHQNKHLNTNIISTLFNKHNPFAPPKKLSLDTNTDLTHEPPRDVMQYITPKPSRSIDPRYYRETPFVIPPIENGEVTIAEYVPTDITPYTNYQLINNAQELYETYYAQQDSVYLAERTYVLQTNEWQGLTSCSPQETLMYLEAEAEVEIGFSQQINKYFIRLNPASEQDSTDTTVRHIFYALPLSKIKKIEDPYLQECVRSLLFDPWGFYQSSEDAIVRQMRLRALPPLERAGVLLAFYSRFQPGTLKTAFNNDIELINAIKSEGLGRCELRVTPLYLDMQRLGINKKNFIWTNAVHAFVETTLDNAVLHMDPGGFPMEMNLIKPSAQEIEELEETLPPKVMLLQELKSSDLSKNNPFITWKNEAQKDSSIDEYVSRLMLKADSLTTRRNILVICEDSNQLELLNARLARYVSREQQRKYYYLPGYEGYSTSSIMINEDGHQKVPSPLVHFIHACTPEDVVCVDMSHIGTHYLWFIRLTEGNIGDYSLPQGQRMLLVIDKNSLTSIGKELYRRLDLVEKMPSFPNGDLYNGCMRYYEAQNAPENPEQFVPLYESPKAVESLKGTIHVKGTRLTLEAGPLIAAMRSGASELYLRNAPFHSKAFRDFLIILCNTRQFSHNQILYKVPSSFSIHHYDAPYSLGAYYSITPLDEENRSSWHYPLNRTTWSLFFKTYYCDGDTSLMEERKGWLAQNRQQSMTILVTDEFPLNAWAQLIDTAKQYEVFLELIVPPDIDLPQPLSEAAQPTHKKDKGKEKERPNSLVRLIVTDDVDFTFEHQLEHLPSDVVYHVTEASKYSDLFESFSADSETLHFTINYGYLLQQLFQPSPEGKRVILKGKLSKEFAQHLESLFSENPYFYLNGFFQKWPAQLLIITDEKQSFPYFNAEQVQVAKEAYWDRLNLLFPQQQETIQRLEVACREIHAYTKMEFTYIQLKTMVIHLNNHPNANPFLPILRIFKEAKQAIEISKTHFPQQRGQFAHCTKLHDRRLLKLSQILLHSYYAFIIGKSGTAKTTTILTQLLQFMKSEEETPEIKLHVGLDRLHDFLEQGGILYLDEANLKENGAYDIFENLFNTSPGIIVKGIFYPLDEVRHRVIFSGNFTSYAHRKQHDFFARHGQVMLFKELRDDYLLANVLKPVFVSLFPNGSPEMDKASHQMMKYFLREYRRINALFPNPPLTPRNLQMMVLRLASHTRRGPFDSVFTVKQIMDLAISDELCGCTKEKDRKDLLIWDEETATKIKDMEHYLNERLVLNSPDYIVVPSRKNIIRLIYDAIHISLFKTDNAYGISGLLQEGHTTTGKSKIIIEVLRQWDFVEGHLDPENQKRHYYYLKSADYEEAVRLFNQAFHEGAVLVIDELNTIPGIEVLLNSFMSGYDLNARSAQKPGFLLFATQNPILYKGRDILSEAVHKRFTEVDVAEYTREELIAIATGKGYEKNLVESLVAQFLYAVNLAELEDVEQKPTLQKFLEVLESFQPLTPRQSDVRAPELFFTSSKRKEREEDKAQAPRPQGPSKKSKPEKEKEKEKDPDAYTGPSYGT